MCNNHRNPIRCIIPPYIADKIAGDDDKQLDNKLRDNRFRSDRKFFASLDHSQQKQMAIKKVKVAKPKANIVLYSCEHAYDLNCKPIELGTITKSKDKELINVYRGVKHTWDFYYKIFNRNSIDNQGMALVNSIHYGKRYNNAMWNGRQMIYGNGDKKVFKSFTSDIDIIGHELAHGVTQYTANFDYENQPGALNESYSDVFGIMIKQYALNQTVKESNWLIGENIMLGKKYALRSLIAPGTAFIDHPSWYSDPQPATMDKYLKEPNNAAGDYGGVHWNSGIPNYAFCMAALEAGGYSWHTVGKVWYAALTENLKKDSTFEDAKQATILQARKLFGKGSKVEQAVIFGWKKAKV